MCKFWKYDHYDKALYEYFQSTAKGIFGILIQGRSAGGYGLQFADIIARPIGVHILHQGQSNRVWDILGKNICEKSPEILPK
jgi:hypothetical protein